MADYCKKMQELDEVHRLLPPEILKDIGITNADELRHIAIVEELSYRLATVLGTAVKGSQRHHLSPAWATNSYQHHHHRPPQPQVYRMDSWRRISDGHANVQKVHTLYSLSNDARMVDLAISLPRFAPARPRHVDVVPPAKQGSKGTGVFLPRAQVYHHRTRGARPPTSGGADVKKPRQQCRQQLRLHAHAVAGELEQPAHKRGDANAASHGCHDELGLPQEWIVY